MDLIKLTSKLIEFKSITPKDDGAIEFLYKILTSNGFKCKILKFGKTKKSGAFNFIKCITTAYSIIEAYIKIFF